MKLIKTLHKFRNIIIDCDGDEIDKDEALKFIEYIEPVIARIEIINFSKKK